MKLKTLWLSWLYLFVLCAVLGFLPQPDGFVKFLLITAAVGFFVPGGLLLKHGEKKTQRQVLTVAAVSLGVTTVLICLNFLSVTMSPVWGNVLHVLLGILGCPMLCGQYWVISLFGWALLLTLSLSRLRKA